MDLSAPCRKIEDATLPAAVRVADPLPCCAAANQMLDEGHRRVPRDTLDHRATKHAPPFGPDGCSCSPGNDSVSIRPTSRRCPPCWRPRWRGGLEYAAEVVRQIYEHTNNGLAARWGDELIGDFADETMPVEFRPLGITSVRTHQLQPPPHALPAPPWQAELGTRWHDHPVTINQEVRRARQHISIYLAGRPLSVTAVLDRSSMVASRSVGLQPQDQPCREDVATLR